MSYEYNYAPLPAGARARRGLSLFVLCLLSIEFLDELLFGVSEAAWPLIRDDLRLSYTQVGILLSLPPLLGNLLESFMFLLADVWRRRVFVLGGGVVFAAATLLIGLSQSFAALLVAMVLINPAAGAFVGLSQAALMDAAPERREQNMARWTLFGSAGNACGALLVAAAVGYGLGWRWLFAGLSVLAVLLLAFAWRFPFPAPSAVEGERAAPALAGGLREALRALGRGEVLRWLLLLQFADFTFDVLLGFLALYFVDVAGAGEAGAALAVIVWTCAGLPGDLLLLPLLERVKGLSYLRVSVCAVLLIFPAFLLVEGYAAKLLLLGLMGFVNSGWYAILQARLYESMPGRSGTAMTLSNVAGFASSLFPLALGAFAQRHGLGAMMWLLLSGPAIVLLGLLTLPRERRE